MDADYFTSTLLEEKKTRRPRVSLNDLIVAAIIDDEFRELLFTDPAKALQIEPNKEPVNLSPEDMTLVLSIRASSLADFSTQILDHINHNGNGNGHSASRKSIKKQSKKMS